MYNPPALPNRCWGKEQVGASLLLSKHPGKGIQPWPCDCIKRQLPPWLGCPHLATVLTPTQPATIYQLTSSRLMPEGQRAGPGPSYIAQHSMLIELTPALSGSSPLHTVP